MKTVYYLLSTFFAILASTACNQPGNTFKIIGQIDHVVDGDVAQLFTIEGNVGTLFMKDTVRNGKFSFKGNTDSLQKLSFMVYGNNFPMTTALIWIAPGSRTKITGKGYYLSSWDIESNVKEQQEEEIYRNVLGELSSTSDSLLLLYYRSIDRMQQTNSNEMESVRKESRRLRDQMDSIGFIQHRVIFDVMATQPVTKSWINKLADYAGYAVSYKNTASYPERNIKRLQHLYNRLSDEQKQSPKGQLIHRYIFPMQLIREGQPMGQCRTVRPAR
jgi:hypothetical protein